MIRISIDPESRRAFRKMLKDYEKKTGTNTEDATIELARACGRQLAQKIPPFGLSASVGKKFEGSIAKQVDRAVKAGNVSAVSGSTAEQVHRNARDHRGQVPKGLRTKGRRKANPIPVGEKERLIKKKKEAAGTAKGAWIAAATALTGKAISGVAKWISRHRKGGRSSILRKGLNTEITLTNELPYIERLQTPAMVKAALRDGYRNALRRIEKIIQKV